MNAPTQPERFDPGSFRDPDTRIFQHNGAVFRCLTARALADWTRLAATDFHARFMAQDRIVPTRQVTDCTALPPLPSKWVAVLEHRRLPLVSYPYEWSFGMLKDAALLQLDVIRAALDEEMTLKDATSFNVQWIGARPTFIDIGSFTAYVAGEPWAGYRQFCETFLYPLLLQAYRNIPFHPWLRGRLDGITAEQCRSLLSGRARWRRGVLAHVYLQAKAQARYEDAPGDIRNELRAAGFGAALIKHNIARLRRTVERLHWNPPRSTWSEYQKEHSYDHANLRRKTDFVRQVLRTRRWPLVWDLGCNTGTYARMAAEHADYVVALDADHVVVERLYQALKTDGPPTILPLVADVADPSPGLGWRGRERRPLGDRGAPGLILCLALMHHLVIGRNIPLADFIAWLAQFKADVILEFVARDDPMVQRLLRNRRDQEFDYSDAAVEAELRQNFGAVTGEKLESGTRTLYHCRPRHDAA